MPFLPFNPSHEFAHTWVEPPPDSLTILDKEHVMLFDVEEDFWTQLSISLDHSNGGINHCCGVSYYYSCVPSAILLPFIENLLPGQIDWVTLNLDGEIVIIVHYTIMGVDKNKIDLKVALIAESNLIVAKLRMMGDQIIQENAARQDMFNA